MADDQNPASVEQSTPPTSETHPTEHPIPAADTVATPVAQPQPAAPTPEPAAASAAEPAAPVAPTPPAPVATPSATDQDASSGVPAESTTIAADILANAAPAAQPVPAASVPQTATDTPAPVAQPVPAPPAPTTETLVENTTGQNPAAEPKMVTNTSAPAAQAQPQSTEDRAALEQKAKETIKELDNSPTSQGGSTPKKKRTISTGLKVGLSALSLLVVGGGLFAASRLVGIPGVGDLRQQATDDGWVCGEGSGCPAGCGECGVKSRVNCSDRCSGDGSYDPTPTPEPKWTCGPGDCNGSCAACDQESNVVCSERCDVSEDPTPTPQATWTCGEGSGCPAGCNECNESSDVVCSDRCGGASVTPQPTLDPGANYCAICSPANSCECVDGLQTGLRCNPAPSSCSDLGNTWQPDGQCVQGIVGACGGAGGGSEFCPNDADSSNPRPAVWCATFDCPGGDTNGDGECTTADNGGVMQVVSAGTSCPTPASGCGQVDIYHEGAQGQNWDAWCGTTFHDMSSCEPSSQPTPTPEAQAPQLSASCQAPHDVAVSWSAIAGASEYILQKCQGADCTSFSSARTIPGGTTSFVDAEPNDGNTFRYRVRAYFADSDTHSAWSNIGTQTLDCAPEAPLACLQLDYSPGSPNLGQKVTLSCDSTTDRQADFANFQMSLNGGDFSNLPRVDNFSASFVVAEPGTYQVRCQVCLGAVDSPSSECTAWQVIGG